MNWTCDSSFTHDDFSVVGIAASVLAGAAAAFVSMASPGSGGTSDRSSGAATPRLMKEQAQYGLGSRGEGSDKEGTEDPAEAAVQDYANRAYPATDIPFSLTVSAKNAWAKIKSQAKKNAVGTWTLAGPSTANFPAILTFSGAAYTTSGRVTALAIDPACSQSKCTVWLGAAGGGIWRTDNALSGNGATWT